MPKREELIDSFHLVFDLNRTSQTLEFPIYLLRRLLEGFNTFVAGMVVNLPAGSRFPTVKPTSQLKLLRVLPLMRKHNIGQPNWLRTLEAVALGAADLEHSRKVMMDAGKIDTWWVCEERRMGDPECAKLGTGKEMDACSRVSLFPTTLKASSSLIVPPSIFCSASPFDTARRVRLLSFYLLSSFTLFPADTLPSPAARPVRTSETRLEAAQEVLRQAELVVVSSSARACEFDAFDLSLLSFLLSSRSLPSSLICSRST